MAEVAEVKVEVSISYLFSQLQYMIYMSCLMSEVKKNEHNYLICDCCAWTINVFSSCSNVICAFVLSVIVNE